MESAEKCSGLFRPGAVYCNNTWKEPAGVCMRIEEVKQSQRKQGRFLVKLEDGEILRVTEEELLRFGLRTGMELEDGTLEALRASARTSSVKAQAAGIIGSRALSKRELTRRLVRRGSEESDAQAAADWLDRELWDSALEELPDPAEILDRLIQKKCRGELSDPREKKRVSDALLRRGFSWSEVRSAMGRYAEMEEDGYD